VEIILKKILNFSNITHVKSLHNELHILYEILKNGPLESMKILENTGSSISGHNLDIKRLVELNIIKLFENSSDKRKRFYTIDDRIIKIINELDD
jgi:DNA-binding transcriptional regulator GbsR (MarR family)